MVADPNDDEMVDGPVEERHLLAQGEVRQVQVADLAAGQLHDAALHERTQHHWHRKVKYKRKTKILRTQKNGKLPRRRLPSVLLRHQRRYAERGRIA